MASLIKPIYKSIIRATVDFIEDNNALGTMPTMQYHNWESRADENLLPPITLLGDGAFGFEENQGRWLIRYELGLSSYKDANLLNEIDLVDAIQQRFGEGEKIDLLNMDTAETENELVVAAFQLMPMGQSELRNYRTIGIELLRTGI